MDETNLNEVEEGCMDVLIFSKGGTDVVETETKPNRKPENVQKVISALKTCRGNSCQGCCYISGVDIYAKDPANSFVRCKKMMIEDAFYWLDELADFVDFLPT